ncbi:MAG: DUF1501 domain-containing protein [Verrucomicrobiales bacterium]
MNNDIFRKADEQSRRTFMVDSAQKFLGVSILPVIAGSAKAANTAANFAPSHPKAAKSVIFINCTGGMSHLDTFDPKEKKDVMGPNKAIPTNADGVRLSQYLPKLAAHGDKIVPINSMTTTQGAHRQGQYIMHRSYAPRGTIVHPVMGSWVLRLSGKRNSSIPGFVTIGNRDGTSSSGFLGPKFAAVPIGDPHAGIEDSQLPSGVSAEDFDRRLELASAMNTRFKETFDHKKVRGYENLYSDAIDLMKAEDLKAFDISAEPADMAAEYGESRFGQGCLLARRLVEHDVRYVEITYGGWDTHYDNFTNVEENCMAFDEGLSALLGDLDRRGLLESTVVAVGTEFGRTPKIVEHHQMGRDHFPRAFSHLIAGGGIQGGQTYGETTSTGMDVDSNPVTPEMFNGTIAYALGLPLEQVIMSPSGRPFYVSNKAKPITAIF